MKKECNTHLLNAHLLPQPIPLAEFASAHEALGQMIEKHHDMLRSFPRQETWRHRMFYLAIGMISVSYCMIMIYALG